MKTKIEPSNSSAVHLPSIERHLKEFFNGIEDVELVYPSAHFLFLARKDISDLKLIQARLYLNPTSSEVKLSTFENKDLVAVQIELAERKVSPENFIKELLTKGIDTPHGLLKFDEGLSGHNFFHQPFHPEGGQARLAVLTILGPVQLQGDQQRDFDWNLKAGSIPYDSVQELMYDFRLGALRSDAATIQIVAQTIIQVDLNSTINNTRAELKLIKAPNLNKKDITLNYRVLLDGKVITRDQIDGEGMIWSEDGEVSRGVKSIDVPAGSIIQCYSCFKGAAFHQAWITDPTKTMNYRRTCLETFDPELKALVDLLDPTQSTKRDARSFETAISWLISMLGFNTMHLGDTKGSVQNAADILAWTHRGNYLLIDCTTGHFKYDKLSLLYGRAEKMKAKLANSGYAHLKVIPMIVTSRSRQEVKADEKMAHELGVSVTTSEDIQEILSRLLILTDAEKIYEELEQEVQANLSQTKLFPESNS